MSYRKNIVIVVGAGASNEADLPVSDDLKENISHILNFSFHELGFGRIKTGDRIVLDSIKIKANELTGKNEKESAYAEYIHAAKLISNAMPQAISIDHFVDAHRDNKFIEICAKLAITRSILSAEKASKLYIDKSNIYNKLDFKSLNKTWYNSFLRFLTENCSKDELKERFKQITLVIFNYDRCIEHYLINSLQNYYSVSENEAIDLMSSLNIFHPYGLVGFLPWQQSNISCDFGTDIDATRLLTLASNIKTFTEGTDPESSEIKEIRQKIDNSEIILFIGFAFHKLNLKLMFDTALNNNQSTLGCFATAHGISKSNVELIEKELRNVLSSVQKIDLNNQLRCNKIFDEYSRHLSLTNY